MIRRLATAIAACAVALAAQAETVTMAFSASDFANAGTAHPGYSGPISGSISWERNAPADPIGALVDIDLEIHGRSYRLIDVGVAHDGSTQTAIGGLERGANVVVGDGLVDDFLIVFDRVNPQILAFAYSIAGKSNALWWNPAQTSARFVGTAVPEPGSALLVALAAVALVWRRRATRAFSASASAA